LPRLRDRQPDQLDEFFVGSDKTVIAACDRRDIGSKETAVETQRPPRWCNGASDEMDCAKVGRNPGSSKGFPRPWRNAQRLRRAYAEHDSGLFIGFAHRRDDGFVGPDKELVELVWLPITQARQLDMPGITAVVLEELQDRITAGMSHAHPVPLYRMLHKKFVREIL